MTCTCASAPKTNTITLTDRDNVVLARLSRDCPAHGVDVVSDTFRPLRVVQKWITRKDMVRDVVKLRRLEGLKLVEVSSDQQSGLLEWLEIWPAESPVEA